MGINLGSSFLSGVFHVQAKVLRDRTFAGVGAGETTFAEAERRSAVAQAAMPRPPLALVVDHVRHAIHVGGEDCVGLGGDLDGVKSLPLGLDSVDDYPRIAELLIAGGLTARQVEKVCFGNFARVFGDVLPS
jgi:membrane dipeptidase